MSDALVLSSYFARQAVKRLSLEGALATHVDGIVALLDPDSSRARVSEIHESLFPFSTRASANAALNSVLRQFNDVAEKRGVPSACG